MSLVVDASVAAKWFVDEEGAAAARRILASERPLVAPDLVVAEVCNVLWKKLRRGEVTSEQAAAAADALPGFFDRLAPAADLAAEALALASAADHPVYDALYVVCAGREGAELATFDARLARLAERQGLALAIPAP